MEGSGPGKADANLSREAALSDAALVAALVAVDPAGLGGVSIRGPAGPFRAKWLTELRSLVPEHRPMRSVPLGIGDDRLLGGLDLTATLHFGKPVMQQGLLAEAHDGLIVLSMAERLPQGTAARIVGAMDSGHVAIARDGFETRLPARFGVVALDEGYEDDESPADALLDRLAFRIDLARFMPRDEPPFVHDCADIAAASVRLKAIIVPEHVIEALCTAAESFGIRSVRALQFTVRVARAHAALSGRGGVDHDDAEAAARLVLGPRAAQLPAAPQEAEEQNGPEDQGQGEDGADNGDGHDETKKSDRPLADSVTEAVRTGLPPALLASLIAGAAPARIRTGAGGKDGQTRRSMKRGRPIGAKAGELKSGQRLALLDTLRAAAPWQRLRRNASSTAEVSGKIIVRKQDFRIVKFKQHTRTTTIFVVDASGSAALHRLAEAKGAVEMLLADCYVRRDEVALIAFRGKAASVLLPPTRSLTRAKRSLAQLPGGGGTPLAAGIQSAYMLAHVTRKNGDTPVLVFLTDGQANIALDGGAGRQKAGDDVTASARLIKAARFSGVLIDTSARPQNRARQIADDMGLRYLAMPSANPENISRMVQAVV